MMKTYLQTIALTIDNKVVYINQTKQLLTEEEKEEKILETVGSSFDTLWNEIKKTGWYLGANFHQNPLTKKRSMQFTDVFLWKERKQPNLDWKITRRYQEISMTLEEMASFPVDSIIQYLKERGIDALPIKKQGGK